MTKEIESVEALEEALSRPTPGVLETLRATSGDLLVLGAGGKMGPTLSRMIRRGLDAIGGKDRRVIAVSRFQSGNAERELRQHGVETISCDLTNRTALSGLPEAPNVIFMAGQKFGTSEAPESTWLMNTFVPALIAERYARSRIVAFSTGCVYSLVPSDGKGAHEASPLNPPGEYANSCVGRERILTYFAKQTDTPMLFFRLCYAIDLRYGVLSDIASKVQSGEPIDLSMGTVNVLWQGDANARAIQCLAHTDSPPCALNVTGIEHHSIRSLAMRFGDLLQREPKFVGQEQALAWKWDATRSYGLFGAPSVSIDEMIEWTASWIGNGRPLLGKPTHFETTSGEF